LIQKFNENEELVYSEEFNNLVVSVGKNFLASRILSNTLDVMNYMAIGSSSTVADTTQLSLFNELARVSLSTATISGSSVTFTSTFGNGVGTGSITEAGIFNESSSALLTFDGTSNVSVSTDEITLNNHGLSTGNQVTYSAGGGTVIGGLTEGAIYYVIKVDTNNIKLAASLDDANSNVPINITAAGVGSNQTIRFGYMLARTTFPVISKSSSETIAIQWVVSVG
jgi:hypothetical protein